MACIYDSDSVNVLFCHAFGTSAFFLWPGLLHPAATRSIFGPPAGITFLRNWVFSWCIAFWKSDCNCNLGSINQSVNPSVNQSIIPSVNQSINHSISQSINRTYATYVRHFYRTTSISVPRSTPDTGAKCSLGELIGHWRKGPIEGPAYFPRRPFTYGPFC